MEMFYYYPLLYAEILSNMNRLNNCLRAGIIVLTCKQVSHKELFLEKFTFKEIFISRKIEEEKDLQWKRKK